MDKDGPGIITASAAAPMYTRVAGAKLNMTPKGVIKTVAGKGVPLAGDALNVGLELADYAAEPSRKQRELNALLVGGGGALASAITGGLDFIPAAMEMAQSGAQGAGIVPEDDVNVGALLNVENYLRELSYLIGKGLGYGRDIPSDRAVLRNEFSKIAEEFKDAASRAREPRPYSGGY